MGIDFLVIGGDLRQKFLVEILGKKHKVKNFGVLNVKDNIGVHQFKECSCVITPVPFTRNGGITGSALSVLELINNLSANQRLIGYDIGSKTTSRLTEKGITVLDLKYDESYATLNAVATAEGAVAQAIELYPNNIHLENVLVLGFGRCAKTLCSKLNGLNANVYVAARKREALSLAGAFGYKTFNLSDLSENIKNFGLIFNTVPAPIIDKKVIKNINKQSVLIDIASAPGGVDAEAVSNCQFTYRLSLGLPSKYSPNASAQIIADFAVDFLNS